MVSISEFQFFNPAGELTVTAGHLPHWQQPGATYFITYRLADSISRDAMECILHERDLWLAKNGIDVTSPHWHFALAQLPRQQQRTFHKVFAAMFERELDVCYGECRLRRPELAELVAESLHYFDGERYRLGAYVVMPNHVHVLARIVPDVSMLDQCYRWKHYQARQINQAIGSTGPVFQSESFDHLVRDIDHFQKFRNYISENPRRAGIADGEYKLYMPQIEGL